MPSSAPRPSGSGSLYERPLRVLPRFLTRAEYGKAGHDARRLMGMKLFSLRSWMLGTAAVIAVSLASVLPAQAHDGAHGEGFGSVDFPVSCSSKAQARFNRAVAMLHTFSPEARSAFLAIADDEPECTMAYWGVAMAARGNPLVGSLSAEALKNGRAAIRRARSVPAKTERERDWIEAVGAFFDGPPNLDRVSRVRAYEAAMEELRNRYDDDDEIEIFYALALNEAADLTDTTYRRQLQAATILERLEGKLLEHPGIPHYLIHSYDYAPIAMKGEPAARRLARIAPESAHALHMPSHIFTMLGLWQDAIQADRAADEYIKANAHSAGKAEPATLPGRYHSLDFLMNAHLQLAQDREAKRILDERNSVEIFPPGFIYSGHVAFAAIPARYALERGDWAAAAQLEIARTPFAQAAAITGFARALGAARSGNAAAARENLGHLATLRLQLADAGEAYWARQTEIYEKAAGAWLLLAEKRRREAVALMRQAADLEDATEKHVALENRLVPMRELLGEMLLEVRQPALALSEFGASLQRSPNRFRSYAGAAKAAERMGSDAAPIARRYHEKLLSLAADGDGERPEIEAARRFVGQRTLALGN
jgi:hypothetical protein